mmetsp:Transcript_5945/g.18936  ORF Transcript_5945/g.18936 Transcript_5945/m.18936 type:complete len:254 (+) Transcript_5945:1570-2331(+)
MAGTQPADMASERRGVHGAKPSTTRQNLLVNIAAECSSADIFLRIRCAGSAEEATNRRGQSAAQRSVSSRRKAYSGGPWPPSACMTRNGRVTFEACASRRGSSPRASRVTRRAGGGRATSNLSSKQRTFGAVLRVTGARQAWPPLFATDSRKSQSPLRGSPLRTKKLCANNAGSRSWPPSQHQPLSVEEMNHAFCKSSARRRQTERRWRGEDRAENSTSVAFGAGPPPPLSTPQRLCASMRGSEMSRDHLLSR